MGVVSRTPLWVQLSIVNRLLYQCSHTIFVHVVYFGCSLLITKWVWLTSAFRKFAW